MTPAQARALLGPGRFASVRIDPMRLAESMEIRRVARALKLTHHDLIARLALVWSWQARAWRPDSAWAEAVPIAVIDELVGARAAVVLMRQGLGALVHVDGEPGLQLVAIDGGPNVRTTWVWAQRGAKGAKAKAERRRANADHR